MPKCPIIIATRGSALALAQANFIADQCREFFPQLHFELRIIKTTGDKLKKSSLAKGGLPKGLFTKELEVALVKGKAHMAVHSLKDLPTDLPSGLTLIATPERADVRDVLVYRSAEDLERHARKNSLDCSSGQSELRGFKPGMALKDFPNSATIATSSERRKLQLLASRHDFKIIEIRGNISTRLQKVAKGAELDGTILALAGLTRLNFKIRPNGTLTGDTVPDGLLATVLDLDTMLPCVGQAAIGIEIRADDERVSKICERLNHFNTFQCITAERAFLRAMGGGCQSPVAAYAKIAGNKLFMRAVSFYNETGRCFEMKQPIAEAIQLGEEIAAKLK